MLADLVGRAWAQRPSLWRKTVPKKGLCDNPAYQWWRDPIRVQPDSWWGMSEDAATLERQASLMRELGVETFRFEVPWRELAPKMPGQGVYDGSAASDPEFGGYTWSPLDAIVEKLEHAGIEPLPVLVFAPTWTMSPDRVSPVAPPRHPGYVADVMHALAMRYGGRIRLWELWNEPDHAHSWSGSAAEYVEVVLQPGAAAVRGAAPDATVLMAGLASHHNLEAMLSAGAGGSFDVANIHIYPASGSARHVRSAVNQARAALVGAGMAATPVWVTECGVATAQPSLPSNFGAVKGEAGQARFVRSIFRTVDADAIFVYQLRDTVIRATDGRIIKRVYWGLTSNDMQRRKPAFAGYRDALRRAPGRGPSRPDARTPYVRQVAS